MDTVELILAAINLVVLFVLGLLCWQFWTVRRAADSELQSLERVSRRLREEVDRSKKKLQEKGAPEGDADGSSSYDQHFSTLAKGLRAHHEETGEILERVRVHNGRIEGVINSIRDFLSDRNRLTDRLQEGYDFQIIKNFSRQVIRCIHQLDGMMSKETGSVSLNEVRLLYNDLLDMLDRNGIERFSPEPGTSFSSLRKVAEVLPQKVSTDDRKLAGKVAEVEHPGYRYVFNDNQHRIIVPAQVKIYEVKKGLNE